MRACMMDYPLTLQSVLERVPKFYAEVEIVSRPPGQAIHRYTYANFYRRARALASGLQAIGLKPGDRVATLCCNHYAHLEAYFGVPVAGGVVHTLNLRLHPHELAFIVNHAEDRFLIVDDVLLPLLDQFRKQVRLERILVVRHGREPLPAGCDDYETVLAEAGSEFTPHLADENDAAAMCFTSGTTGNAKGVLYSHRALVLHAMAFALPDCFGISQHDVVMALAPMFHANTHGLAHVAVLLGCKLVLPGRNLDAESILELFDSEQVTFATAVPTVWASVLEALEKHPGRWKLAPGLRAFVGGTACPESLMRRLDQQGIRLIQVWGMTETTPVAVCSTLKSHMREWPEQEQYDVRIRQGRPLPFIEARVMNDLGEAPWDGASLGELQVRGPWVASSYFRAPETADRWTSDGWLRTGDIATIDAEGYVQIADRSKDLIKSGGEWISSVDLEKLPGGSSGCAGSRRDCRASQQMGGAAAGACGVAGRNSAYSGRITRISGATICQMATAGCLHLQRRTAAHFHWKAVETGIEAAVFRVGRNQRLLRSVGSQIESNAVRKNDTNCQPSIYL